MTFLVPVFIRSGMESFNKGLSPSTRFIYFPSIIEKKEIKSAFGDSSNKYMGFENIQSSKKETKKSDREIMPMPETMLADMEKSGLDEYAAAYKRVIEFCELIRQQNGKALLVGGAVRDLAMGKVSKDYDLEVYGLPAEEVELIAEKIGKVKTVGRAFGILKIPLGGKIDMDVSLPRKDSKIGAGHKGFEVKTDPSMSIEEAAKRRDFTMNSMAADPLTGELFDPFGGEKDIKKRILRVTDPERFKDDPLRVLRALQFVGRFGMQIDDKSVLIIREMIPYLKELPKERIGEEWKKMLLKAEKASMGLSAGMALGVFHEIHPEFPPLEKTKQEPDWHPEGDVWIHTLMVLDEASKIVKRENLPDEKAMTVLLASLCHDLGKPYVTTIMDGRIKSHGHEQAGEEPTKKFLATIGIDNLTREKVVRLVINHLIPTMLYVEENIRGNKIKDGSIRRLAKRIHPATIQELVYVSQADHLGRGDFGVEARDQLLIAADNFPAGEWLLRKARDLKVEESRPADLTKGREWLRFGFKAGVEIGELIRLSNDLRDEKAWTKEAVFSLVEGTGTSKEAITILSKALGRV